LLVNPRDSNERSEPEEENNLKMLFSDDGRRLLLSKGSGSDHSEKIATE
jgi:hypothetical protein